MSSAHNPPPRTDVPSASGYDVTVPKAMVYATAVCEAVPCGAAALHRSRRLSLLSLTAGLCAGLLALTLAQPVSSVRVSPPLAMDMRTLPPPMQALPAPPKEATQTPLLAETSPHSVNLPPPREEGRLPKERPPEKMEKPKPVQPKVKEAVKPMATKAEVPKAVAEKPVATKPVTPAPATPARLGDAGQPSQRDHAAALAVLLQAIERHKSYPKQARRTGAQGVAQLVVRIGRDGKVAGAELRQGSGHTVLDSATRQLGEKLAGLDTGVRGNELRIVVPVNYRLS